MGLWQRRRAAVGLAAFGSMETLVVVLNVRNRPSWCALLLPCLVLGFEESDYLGLVLGNLGPKLGRKSAAREGALQ
jgi:hypothetical protein